jgi:hypothetical protein
MDVDNDRRRKGVRIFFSLLGLVLPAAAAPALRPAGRRGCAPSSHQTPSAFDHVRILCKLKVKLWYTQVFFFERWYTQVNYY